MTVLEEFKEQVVDRLPDVDSYERHDGLTCVIIDDRCLIDTYRAANSVKAIMPDANIVHYRDPINSIQDHDLLLTSEEFWNRFDSDTILIFQPDSLMLNRLDISWLYKYNYIGAPWDVSRAKKHGTWVGNGGFSLRNVLESKYVVMGTPYSPKKEHHEDTYFSTKMRNVAPLEVAKRFSVEWQYYPKPTGIHDVESHLSQNLVKQILYNSELYQIAQKY